jgi:uncharacterized membrane protein
VWDVLAFINLLGCGLVQGTYTFEMVVVVPALRGERTQASALIHRALFSHLPHRYMPWSGVSGGMSALALIAFAGHHITSTARILYAIGFALWSLTFYILVAKSRPLDQKITEEQLAGEMDPAVYAVDRKAWDRLMYIRGPLGAIAFALFIIATLS